MSNYKMALTEDQLAILNGRDGETVAKVLKTLVMFGDIFGADKLIPVTHNSGHLVTSFGATMLDTVFDTMDELIKNDIKVKGDFTVDPRPTDYKNVKCNLLDKLIYNKMIYSKQDLYEEQLKKVGLKDDNAFTCACYLDEVGNQPKPNDVLSWAESSAVVYANSVLGARVNRNSGMLDLFGSIVGLVPNFGLVTDKGRKATWKIILKTTKLPEAQVLGSAIGMKVMEEVPYVYGLDKYLGNELNDDAKDYLKDFGAATASNGAVGLYHIDGLTPEAKEEKEHIIEADAKEYIIDDAEIERVYRSYPIMWKNKDSAPFICFIGCPHLSFNQLMSWSHRLTAGLASANRKTVARRTVFTAAPDVVEKFKKTKEYQDIIKTKATIASICPLMYTTNPLTKKRAIATCSNKLRTYSFARYYKEDDLLAIICGKEVK